MRSPRNSVLFGGSILLLAIMACNLPVTVTPPVIAVTETPTVPPLPVVNSPGIVTLHMLDANDGWALSDTQVLTTSDGGVTWHDATPPGATDLGWSADAFFLSAAAGWVLVPVTEFTAGTLYRTTDGGHTWTSVSVPFSSGGVQFQDPSNGWAIASLGAGAGSMAVAIFRTTDRGDTWTRVFVDDPTVPGSSDTLPLSGLKMGFTILDATHTWVGGMTPVDGLIYLYASSDGAATWALQPVDLPPAYSGAQTANLAPRFFGPAEGVLGVGVYGDSNGMVFYLSHDSGLTWTPTTPVESSGQFSLATQTDFFAWDGGPSLFASHDAGTTWTTISPNIHEKDIFMTFQFVNATTGWALTGDTTPHYSLYRTLDGGTTWTALIP